MLLYPLSVCVDFRDYLTWRRTEKAVSGKILLDCADFYFVFVGLSENLAGETKVYSVEYEEIFEQVCVKEARL